jgi:transcriptional regulator with XRE-family HTH domain
MKADEGKRLKLFMEKEGIQQHELAAIVGKTQSHISKYISGVLKVPLEVIKILHLKLGLNYTWFFHGKGNMKINTEDKATLLTDIRELNAMIGTISANQESMRDILNRLVKDFYSQK